MRTTSGKALSEAYTVLYRVCTMRTGGRSDSLSVQKLLAQRSEVILYSGATDLT